MYYFKLKRNQNYGIIVFVKNNFSVDFNEYGCNKCNIDKLVYLIKFVMNRLIYNVYKSQ